MKNENLLQTLSYLALRMENSGTELIEAIVQGKLVRMDAARTNEPRRLVIRRKTSLADENHLAVENQSELQEMDIQEVVRGIEQLANYLEITPEQAIMMPAAFDFSGGEIDNIVRKVVMEEVLHGTRPTLPEIEELCRHEKIGEEKHGGIGFRK